MSLELLYPIFDAERGIRQNKADKHPPMADGLKF